MSKDSVVAFRSPEAVEDPLTELLRTGAKRLIQQAITKGYKSMQTSCEHVTHVCFPKERTHQSRCLLQET